MLDFKRVVADTYQLTRIDCGEGGLKGVKRDQA